MGYPTDNPLDGSGTPDLGAALNEIRELRAQIAQMLIALRAALPELREDLESLVECNTVGTPAYAAHQPLPADLDREVLMCATDKKAAHDAVVAAIAAAEGR
jgi:hypothetical protein